ncbi:GrpB family protein [Halalkalibacter wakoensis]|uniref:GrpB family protein n=1 Tax=Halalkalibacter wakoensis TaxID=127891 RepID=UPI000AB90E18|nr:GrpB family protein [Halalkalibacter wakoensis]
MRKVEVLSYQTMWPSLYEKEVKKLKTIFGTLCMDIHHIGSTAVNGLKAKPVIDMMMIVSILNDVDRFNSSMESIGYEPMGENGIVGRRFFQKGGDDRTHHLHIFEQGNEHINRHLAFRNYLRATPEEAKQYGQVKQMLSKQFPQDIASYIKGKENVVKEIERRALIWQKN